MQKVQHKGWKNCWRVANRTVELVVTADVGPRIIRFGFSGDDNLFKEYPDQVGKTGGKAWRIYGGHRLWHAPEADPRTYYSDNTPVHVERRGGMVRVVQPPESTTGIQKEIDIRLAPKRAHVRLVHRLRNTGLWPVELAPWALSVMAQGGTAIIPLPPRGKHPRDLLPSSTLTLWPYTDMSDPRWTWGRKYVMLRQDPRIAKPQKLGAFVPDGWVAYTRNGQLFVKKFRCVPGATYPDCGCSVETFTNEDMLEVETLGPMTRLEPGAMVEHVEDWFLFRNVPVPASESEVDANVLPRIRAA